MIKRSPACPDFGPDYVTAYCFGDLGEAEREAFERHLTGCEACRSEVRRLESAVRVLRSDRSLGEGQRAFDMAVLTGVSARLPLPFAGHLTHVTAACSLYALLYAVAMVLEVTYRLEQFSPSVWFVSAGVFAWVFGTSVAGLHFDWKSAARSDRPRVTYYSLPVFVAAAVLLYAALGVYLPDRPVTGASFQTMPAQSAYLKDVGYFLPLGLAFLSLPFHFVLSMQRELSEGRHRMGLGLLSGENWGVTPKGTFYVPAWALAVTLFGALVASLMLTTHLLDNLSEGPHRSLFVQLVLWRVVLYFGLGLECLFWYKRVLNDLKRECLGAVVAASQVSGGRDGT
jgi:hypothetical protein